MSSYFMLQRTNKVQKKALSYPLEGNILHSSLCGRAYPNYMSGGVLEGGVDRGPGFCHSASWNDAGLPW
jgi:hypothetical protein